MFHRKLCKALGLKRGASLPRIVAEIEALKARRATDGGGEPPCASSTLATRLDLSALLRVVEAMLPVAKDAPASQAPGLAGLSAEMQALKDSHSRTVRDASGRLGG